MPLWAYFGLIYLGVIHALDVMSTYLCLSTGQMEEANPLMACVLESHGWGGMCSAKMISFVPTWIFIWLLVGVSKCPSFRLGAKIGLGFACPVMTLVVISNIVSYCCCGRNT